MESTSSAEAARPSVPTTSRQIEELWFELARTEWTSLAVVPGDVGQSAPNVGEALAAVGSRFRDLPVKAFTADSSASENSLDHAVAAKLAESAAAQQQGGPGRAVSRPAQVIFTVEPVVREPLGMAVLQAVDAVLLCVQIGRTRLEAARRTLAMIGRERVVGCLVTRAARRWRSSHSDDGCSRGPSLRRLPRRGARGSVPAAPEPSRALTARREVEPDLPDLDEIESSATPAARVAALVAASRRRPVLATAVFAVLLAACGAYYLKATPMYRVETKILTQKPQAVPTIGRQIQDDEGPTRAASEIVHRRESLISLVKQTSLFADPVASALPKVGLLDRIAAAARQPRGSRRQEGDALHLLVERVNKALLVKVQDGLITISIDWPDAQQAYAIVEAAEQNFLEARHVQEITAMDEMISLLQGRTLTLRNDLDRVIAEEFQRSRSTQGSEPVAISGGWLTPAPRVKSAEVARLQSLVEAKERAIRDVEEFRRRRLSELQAQLDEKRGAYSDAYPQLLALRQDIEALSRESPQIVALRAELRKLQAEQAQRFGQETGRQQPSGGPLYHAPSPGAAARQSGPAYESERVRDARFQYQHMVEQLDAAKLDLDAARAAFKYRYSVVWPAQLPRAPISPDPLTVLGLGALAAALIALLGTAWVEKRSGLIVEERQLERELGLPVLGEIGLS